jgi:hypothetical protein
MSKYCKPAAPVNVLDALCANQDLLTLEGEFTRHGLRVVGTGDCLKAQCPNCISTTSDTLLKISRFAQVFTCNNCGLTGGLSDLAAALNWAENFPPQVTSIPVCDNPGPLPGDNRARNLMKVLWDRAAPIPNPLLRELFANLGRELWLAKSLAANLRWFPGSREGLADHDPAILARWKNIIDGSWTGFQVTRVDANGHPAGQTTVGECIGSAIKFGPPLPTNERGAPLCIAPSLRGAAFAARVLEGRQAVWVLPGVSAISRFPVLANVSKLQLVRRGEDDEVPLVDVSDRYLGENKEVEIIIVSVLGGVR